jgi:hypothetical protein
MKVIPGIVALLVAAPAAADVRIIVDPKAPFSERELADAVRLRWIEVPDKDITIQVGALGADQLIVVVGDRTETVALPDGDRAAAARVVAVIATSLTDGGGSPEHAAPAIARSAPATPSPAPWSLSFGAGYEGLRTGDPYLPKYGVRTLHGGIARTVMPNVRALLTISTGILKAADYVSHARIVPVRLGIEASNAWLALELGLQDTTYERRTCADGWGHSYGAYVAGKVFVPISAHVRTVIALGGHYLADKPSAITGLSCTTDVDLVNYGWLGQLGLEWNL